MQKHRPYDAKFIKRHIFRYKPATRIIIYNYLQMLSNAKCHSLSPTIDTLHSYSIEDTWIKKYHILCFLQGQMLTRSPMHIHFGETVDHWKHKCYTYKVRCRYNVVNFLQNSHIGHPIARLLGRGMGGWGGGGWGGGGVGGVGGGGGGVFKTRFICCPNYCKCIHYRVILGRVLTAPDYMMKVTLVCLDIY